MDLIGPLPIRPAPYPCKLGGQYEPAPRRSTSLRRGSDIVRPMMIQAPPGSMPDRAGQCSPRLYLTSQPRRQALAADGLGSAGVSGSTRDRRDSTSTRTELTPPRVMLGTGASRATPTRMTLVAPHSRQSLAPGATRELSVAALPRRPRRLILPACRAALGGDETGVAVVSIPRLPGRGSTPAGVGCRSVRTRFDPHPFRPAPGAVEVRPRHGADGLRRRFALTRGGAGRCPPRTIIELELS